MLTNAGGWRQLRTESIAWTEYVKYGDAQAWTTVRKELERVRQAFTAAAAVDNTLATRYPKLAALFQAMSAPALKGGATRKKNKASTAQAPVPAPAPAPAAPAAAVTHPVTAVTPPSPSAG